MITLHFHLQPQYKCELFHINFTSFHCTGRYELNQLTSLTMCSFIAQLVEHRTGIAEVTGSNPVEALIFCRILLSNCLNWKIYCDDHSSLSSTTAVQIWIISYKLHISQHCWPSIWKPRLNDRNISTQHTATLLGATCCVRLAALLWRAATCCELQVKLVRMPWCNIVAGTCRNTKYKPTSDNYGCYQ